MVKIGFVLSIWHAQKLFVMWAVEDEATLRETRKSFYTRSVTCTNTGLTANCVYMRSMASKWSTKIERKLPFFVDPLCCLKWLWWLYRALTLKVYKSSMLHDRWWDLDLKFKPRAHYIVLVDEYVLTWSFHAKSKIILQPKAHHRVSYTLGLYSYYVEP